MTEHAFNLISGMLNRNPKQRYGYKNADKIKNAAWFKQEPWGKDWVRMPRHRLAFIVSTSN